MTDIERPLFFPETIIIFLEWGCLNHMSLHITVWEVSVMSPAIEERGCLWDLVGGHAMSLEAGGGRGARCLQRGQ